MNKQERCQPRDTDYLVHKVLERMAFPLRSVTLAELQFRLRHQYLKKLIFRILFLSPQPKIVLLITGIGRQDPYGSPVNDSLQLQTGM